MTKKEIRNDYEHDLIAIMGVIDKFIYERDKMEHDGSDTLTLKIHREDVDVIGRHINDYLMKVKSITELNKIIKFPYE